MLETEIKKLNASIVALTEAVNAMAKSVDAEFIDSPPEAIIDAVKPEADVDAEQPATPDFISRDDCVDAFIALTDKYGDKAQEAIKDAIFLVTGSQALSQAEPEQIPYIYREVMQKAVSFDA